jgi:hypothetical protein
MKQIKDNLNSLNKIEVDILNNNKIEVEKDDI